MEFNIIIGGEAGQGLVSIETRINELLSRLNYHFFGTKNYMSRIRGGHNFHMIRIADRPVHALNADQWDMLIALDKETEDRHSASLKKNGIFIDQLKNKEISELGKQKFGDIKASNNILAGLSLAVIDCREAVIKKLDIERSVLEQLQLGYELAKKWGFAQRYCLKPKAKEHYNFTGNQALALGAILGGCQFMSGYPMTPSTGIMDYFSKAAQALPIHFEQAEDEISAINTALGASYSGLRSMVATSGGGFALMVEGVALAGMTETPIVIIVAQRPGPATGLPTRTEQGELNFVLHAGHGEFPRAVFAPGSIEEALDIARTSFELADRYQTPVFILTDQYLADSQQVLEKEISLELPNRTYQPADKGYKRYKLTASGVSPLTYPGLSDALVKVDSDEHDEEGKITEDLDFRIKINEKRLKKLKLIEKEVRPPTFYGDKTAKAVIISWGSNKQLVEEAVDELKASGKKIAALHFSQVYPLSAKAIAKFGLDKKKLICVENNATAQFAKLLKRELGLNVEHNILKYNGECFTVKEIYQDLIKYLKSSR